MAEDPNLAKALSGGSAGVSRALSLLNTFSEQRRSREQRIKTAANKSATKLLGQLDNIRAETDLPIDKRNARYVGMYNAIIENPELAAVIFNSDFESVFEAAYRPEVALHTAEEKLEALKEQTAQETALLQSDEGRDLVRQKVQDNVMQEMFRIIEKEKLLDKTTEEGDTLRQRQTAAKAKEVKAETKARIQGTREASTGFVAEGGDFRQATPEELENPNIQVFDMEHIEKDQAAQKKYQALNSTFQQVFAEAKAQNREVTFDTIEGNETELGRLSRSKQIDLFEQYQAFGTPKERAGKIKEAQKFDAAMQLIMKGELSPTQQTLINNNLEELKLGLFNDGSPSPFALFLEPYFKEPEKAKEEEDTIRRTLKKLLLSTAAGQARGSLHK